MCDKFGEGPNEDMNKPKVRLASRKREVAWLWFVFGGYLVFLGGVRLWEVLPLAVGPYVVEGFPAWLLPYLATLCGAILISGASLIAAGVCEWRGSSRARVWGACGAAGVMVFATAHAMFLVHTERAFADGGFIWGVVHLLTLTRLPTTGTEAGIAGYKVGLGVGIAIWLGIGLVLLAASRQSRRGSRALTFHPSV